ncbi:MAG: DUF4214 domain-containing protein, partial [Candidatus Competibacteraceae bacterium]|nr:DUF4214 domain-containing protein [Candidatus Competibacteraceae bacterium]
NVPYGAVVTAAGGRFPYTFTATGLPAGLTLTTTGALTGTPTASGDFTPTITVTDAQGQTGARVYPLTVAAATALTLVNPTLPDGVVNAPYQQTLTALGGRFPYTFSATSLPAGLILSADGLLTGTPAQAGDVAVVITVQDPAGHTATASTVLTVRPAAFTRPDAGQTGETLSVALTTPSGATCTLDDQNTRTFNVGDLGAPATNPPGVTLTDGLLQLVVKGCTAGGVTLTVTVAYPNALPPGAQYWKYGPTFDDATNHWYVLPGAHLAGNIATFTLIDGGLGDADLIANAQITDPGGTAISLNTIDGAVPAVLPIGEPYRVDFQARCNAGACPADSVYAWSLADDPPPDGLTLTGAGATATLSGTPTRVGRYPFTVQVLMRGDQPTTTQQRYTVDIIDPAATRLITHYYVSILEREPDAEGLAYWQNSIAELQGRGQDAKPVFRDMANFFFNSPEYLGRNTTDRQFITNLYLTFFQREPDEDGYAFWLEQLANGMVRNTAMAGFLYSPEFTTFMEEVGF